MNRLIFTFLFFVAQISTMSAPCDGAGGARHLNPDDTPGKPTGGFVASTAQVFSGVFLGPNVEVCDRAEVRGKTLNNETAYPYLTDKVKIYGRARILGNVTIRDEAEIYGRAQINANPDEFIQIREGSKIFGDVSLFNFARVQGKAHLSGTVKLQGYGRVCGERTLEKNEVITSKTDLCPLPYAEIKINTEPDYFINREIEFDASATSNTADFSGVFFLWDFGDNAADPGVSGSIVKYQFINAAEYFGRIEVVDSTTGTDVAYFRINIQEPTNQDPVAFIKADKFSTTEDFITVKFDGRGSFDRDGIVATYEWDFGDGGKASGSRVEHTFSGIGRYFVDLKVTDDLGGFHTDRVLIEVNCELEAGDTTCSKIVGREDKFIPIKDKEIAIELVPNLSPISDEQLNLDVTLEVPADEQRFDLTSKAFIEDGHLKIKTSDVIATGYDLREPFTLSFNVVDDSETGHSSTIKNIFIGSAEIKGTATPAGAIVKIKGINNNVVRSIKTPSSGKYSFKNLPYDSYLITLIVDGKSINYNQRVATPNSVQTLNLPDTTETSIKSSKQNKLLREKILKGKDPRSNFEIKKLVFAPAGEGEVVKETWEVEVPAGEKNLLVAYKVFSQDGKLPDDFSLTTIDINNFPPFVGSVSIDLNNVIESEDSLATNGWNTREIDLTNSTIGISGGKITFQVTFGAKTKKGTENEDTCKSAIALSYSLDSRISKPRLLKESLKRIDRHGRKEVDYFPSTLDLSFVNSSFLPATFPKENYYLEFSFSVETKAEALKSVLISVEGVQKEKDKLNSEILKKFNKTNLYAVNGDEVTINSAYIFNVENIVRDGAFNSFKVNVRLPLPILNFKAESLAWLEKWSENSASNVDIFFSVLDNNGDVSNEEKLSFIPLYDVKSTQCDLYGNTVDGFLRWHVYKTFSLMLNDNSLKTRLSCNDGSRPFGGYFSPHTTGHRIGKSLDILYPIRDPEDGGVNSSATIRAATAASSFLNSEENSNLTTISNWAQDSRLGFNLISSFKRRNTDNVSSQFEIIISNGSDVPFPKVRSFSFPLPPTMIVLENGSSWNESVFSLGQLPSIGSGYEVIPFTFEGVNAGVDCVKQNLEYCGGDILTMRKKDHVNHAHINF